MMYELDSADQLDALPAERGIELLFFSQARCGVCAPVKEKVEQLLSDYPSVSAYSVDTTELPAAAGRFEIFTVPAVLLFVEGKETVRYVRYFSLHELEDSLERYTALLYR
jgi:thioredoxin-like negative regulator of GroEL